MLEVPLSLSWLYFRLASFDRVTQLVEYFLDMEEVVGSSPIVITTFPPPYYFLHTQALSLHSLSKYLLATILPFFIATCK